MVAGTDFQRKLCIWGGEVWSSGKEGGITCLLGRGSEADRGKMPQKMRGFIHLSTHLCGQHDRPGKDILTVTSEGRTAGRAHVLVSMSCRPSCPRQRTQEGTTSAQLRRLGSNQRRTISSAPNKLKLKTANWGPPRSTSLLPREPPKN